MESKKIDTKEFPILEFDETRVAIIEATNFIQPKEEFEYCVITFFRDVIEKMKTEGKLKEVACLHCETVDLPIYEAYYQGKKVHITLGYLGAAGSAGFLEELIAYGFQKFIVCGGAGVLKKDIAVGHVIVPVSAVRDEGVSYHYIKPSREIECNLDVLKIIEDDFNIHNIRYIKEKTWTTDSFYRETKEKVELRKAEGCVTVEMEAAAFMAVSQFRNVKLGIILYGGDDLSGVEWDSRSWNSRSEIRENLVEISLRICCSL
ncbi:nucleoside phosphorylase [Paenibacillus sp. Marseille-P2973]|uniref:nucleoside phosphorylase n=1 Tax=Paenibacillus sp. Marseille-P2973 TaxID=1871032 RepID=UPI001B370004|nr:nucleoside phosphorylase [Paenibacillus sp. Marseille-P2973]MBQ4898733.1 nucleoside phosphorylase [Paenibacillus sp. Marseille-P2973]